MGPFATQNQGVLDALELARRLREAMDHGPHKISLTRLAGACNVTPQAVNGWRTTGKIAKKHLTTIARLTNKPIAHFLESASAAREPDGQYTIEQSQLLENYQALPDGLKEHLARKAVELRAYVDALPPFLREGLKPPAEWDAYKQFERELEADMEKRLLNEAARPATVREKKK